MSRPERESRPGEGAADISTAIKSETNIDHRRAAEALLASWEAGRGDYKEAFTRDLLAAVAHALLEVAEQVQDKYVGGTW